MRHYCGQVGQPAMQ